MKDLQQKIRKFCDDNDMNAAAPSRFLDLVSEVGEVSKEVLKMNDYGRKELEFRDEIRSELGDVLFSLVALANKLDVDLENALELVLAKYEKRLKKGSAGSEND